MNAENQNPYEPTSVPVADVPAAGEAQLAERWKRFAAALVDALIIAVPASLVVFLVFGGLMSTGGFMAQLLQTVVGAAISFTAYVVINWKSLEASGQTIGKKLLKIRIVRMDGSAVGARHAIFRRYLPVQLAALVPFIGGLLAMVDALFIFRSSQRCLHDDFADTRVVDA